jgi:hypothetical protein
MFNHIAMKVVSLLCITLILASCKKPEDELAPVLSPILISREEISQPENVIDFFDNFNSHAGEEIFVGLYANDNVELSEITYTLRPVGLRLLDNGQIDFTSEKFEPYNQGDWSILSSNKLSGTSQFVTWRLTVPDNICGLWELSVVAKDNKGLVSEPVKALFKILIDDAFTIDLNDPNTEQVGSSYYGYCYPAGLTPPINYNFEIYSLEEQTLFWSYQLNAQNNNYFSIESDPFTQPGQYVLVGRATDNNGLTKIESFDFTVYE